MVDVSKSISNYIQHDIRLSLSDISASAKSRQWILDRIERVINDRTDQPVLHSSKFVNFGSYFKGTKVQVVDEYDVLVVIDSNTGVFSKDGVAIGTGLGNASPNHKYDSTYYKSDGSGVSPSKTLNWLKGVVEEAVKPWGGESPIRNGQAVTAYIKSSDVKIDLVPAGIFSRDFANSTFYNIPRGDAAGGWITTQPRDDIDKLYAVAKDKRDFCNVVRITKRIRDSYNFTVASFAVETAVVEYGSHWIWQDNLHADVRGVLLHIADRFRTGVISDPYNSSNNLIDDVSSLQWYADRITKIVDQLDNCRYLQDQSEANDCINALFDNS